MSLPRHALKPGFAQDETFVPATRRAGRPRFGVVAGGLILTLLAALALLAPWLGTTDPGALDPAWRNQPPGAVTTVVLATGREASSVAIMGTDSLGRDVYSRVLFGARVSLAIGLAVTLIAVAMGTAIGLVAGYFRWLDALLMRLTDGLMAIPGILLALALVTLWGAGIATVIAAIALPEIPRTVRLVRSIVLAAREEPYVEAAVGLGTPDWLILWRHILPAALGPLAVQGTYVCASAILVEAILSFLGVGIPTDIPSWGNIMAEGRTLFRVYPHTILFPGMFLALTVLAVNLLGDGLRDTLDPRSVRRG